MNDKLLLLCGVVAIVLIIVFLRRRKKAVQAAYTLPNGSRETLTEKVSFYQNLDAENKTRFEERIRHFLATTRITGVGTEVSDADRLLIASSAIIPIFAFPDWQYRNINEILLYKEHFNKEYHTTGTDRNVLGLVGEGAMQRQMILSQQALRAGFSNDSDAHNTAIHEFVHLVDKADGAVDGVPEYLLDKQYILPWVRHMREEIQQMRQHGTDINPYGATNDAEFFAVISEYFFEKPQELEERHPELYKMLRQMFHTPQPSGQN